MVVPIFANSSSYPTYNSEIEESVVSIDQKQKSTEDIELAIKNIERCIVSDNSFLELADKLKIRQGI